MLGILWIAFLFNQADRAMYGFVMPLIKDDLKLTDIELGVVATTFHIFYGLLAPLAGYVGDIFRRSRILVASIGTWSLAALLTGFSANMTHLILFRGASLSLGEAFYLPSANSLIGQYHEKTRAFAMSIHQTALYCGMIGSGVIAGYLGQTYGWRTPFFVFGVLGLFWALLMFFRLKEPDKKPVQPEVLTNKKAQKISFKEVVGAIFKKKSVLMLCMVFGCMVFVNVGYVTWMPTLLHEKFGLSLAQAGFSSMFYHVICAFIGVMAGGKIADYFSLKRKNSRLLVVGVGFLLSVPFVYIMGATSSLPICIFSLAGFGLFRGVCDSAFFAGLFDVVEPKYRSSGQGLVISFGLLVGSIAPVFLGWIKTILGLSLGISMMSIASLLGAISIAITLVLFFNRDYVASSIQK